MTPFPTRPSTTGRRSRLAAVSAVLASLTLAASAALTAGPAAAAPADLDSGFAGDGIATLDVLDQKADDTADAMAVLPDGKVVVAGSSAAFGNADMLLSRFNADGSLDKTFNGGFGLAGTGFTLGSTDLARAMAVQPDGRIVLAGETGNATTRSWAVARFNADGTLDKSFDADGRWKGPETIGRRHVVRAAAVEPSGHILLAGTTDWGGGHTEWNVSRLNPDGTHSWSNSLELFGVNGLGANAIVLQPDGWIVVAGALASGNGGEFGLVRLNTNGGGDQTFGNNGVATTDFGPGPDEARAVAIQPDGRIVTAGWSAATPQRFALTRHLPDGTADPSFGDAGKVNAAVTSAATFARALAIQPNGKLVVAGISAPGLLAAARYNPNGALDESFGAGGALLTDIGPGNDLATAAAIGPDGKILLAGNTDAGSGNDIFVARLQGGNGSGYWALDSAGKVYPFGAARHYGDGRPNSVDIEPNPARDGYWTLDAGGVVHPSHAPHLGNAPALPAGEQAVSLSATPSGQGYWIFTNRGRAFAFGDAKHHGDMSGTKLNAPVLDSIATPDGSGYYMVASDGGVFAFPPGVTPFYGSMGATKLNKPVQSLVPDPDGVGYWLVASDGGVFAFQADFRGSYPELQRQGHGPLNAPITGMVPYGDGYLMVGTDGGIFVFSNLKFEGSKGDNPPKDPVVSVAAL